MKKMLIKFVFWRWQRTAENLFMPYLNGSQQQSIKHRKAIEKRHLKCKLDASSKYFQMAPKAEQKKQQNGNLYVNNYFHEICEAMSDENLSERWVMSDAVALLFYANMLLKPLNDCVHFNGASHSLTFFQLVSASFTFRNVTYYANVSHYGSLCWEHFQYFEHFHIYHLSELTTITGAAKVTQKWINLTPCLLRALR